MATMTVVKCPCGTNFSARLADVNRGWGKFCSKSCKTKFAKSAPVCSNCNDTGQDSCLPFLDCEACNVFAAPMVSMSAPEQQLGQNLCSDPACECAGTGVIDAKGDKPMLSVERELLESISSGAYCKPDVMAKLRALLDKPASVDLVECDACPTSGGCVSACMKAPKPAAQHQGEPVAWVVFDNGFIDDHTVVKTVADEWVDRGIEVTPLYAEQPAPVACTSCNGSGEYIDAIGDWRGYCKCPAGLSAKNRAYPPAPVAVVMPERMDPRDPYDSEANQWNACLDEVARLNGVKP